MMNQIQIQKKINALHSRNFRLRHRNDPEYKERESKRRKKSYKKHKKKRIAESNEYNKKHRKEINKRERDKRNEVFLESIIWHRP